MSETILVASQPPTVKAPSIHSSPLKRPYTSGKPIGHYGIKTLRGLDIGCIFIIRAFYIIGATIFAVIVVGLILSISLGGAALNGVIMLLIGNGILRAAHLAHYTTNACAAQIGAVGGAISTLCLGLATSCITPSGGDQNSEPRYPSWLSMIFTVILGTITGPTGYAVLHDRHVDLKGIDALHATRAGVLGGVIVAGPGTLLIGPAMVLVYGAILSPLWIAMLFGFEWAFARSSETITSDSHSYMMCSCVGTWGRDPEVVNQIEELNNIERRHKNFRRGVSNALDW